jgi:hypothetical protein
MRALIIAALLMSTLSANATIRTTRLPMRMSLTRRSLIPKGL